MNRSTQESVHLVHMKRIYLWWSELPPLQSSVLLQSVSKNWRLDQRWILQPMTSLCTIFPAVFLLFNQTFSESTFEWTRWCSCCLSSRRRSSVRPGPAALRTETLLKVGDMDGDMDGQTDRSHLRGNQTSSLCVRKFKKLHQQTTLNTFMKKVRVDLTFDLQCPSGLVKTWIRSWGSINCADVCFCVRKFNFISWRKVQCLNNKLENLSEEKNFRNKNWIFWTCWNFLQPDIPDYCLRSLSSWESHGVMVWSRMMDVGMNIRDGFRLCLPHLCVTHTWSSSSIDMESSQSLTVEALGGGDTLEASVHLLDHLWYKEK